MKVETRTLIEFKDIAAVEIECTACHAVMAFNGQHPVFLSAKKRMHCVHCNTEMPEHSYNVMREVCATLERCRTFENSFKMRLVISVPD
jgi:hypothetical protein